MKKTVLIISIIALVVLISGAIIYLSLNKKEDIKLSNENGISVAMSLEDQIQEDTVWCGTFQLIWNDLKNDLAKQDIVFTPQTQEAKNLNKETFKQTDISDDSYYKVYGNPTYELKAEIEKNIKEKFNEESDILDNFNWVEKDDKNYFLYAMLKKHIEFNKEFEEFKNETFKNTEGIDFFGFDEDSESILKSQVQVLYYDSDEDFAIKLATKQGDEVILCKNPYGDTFSKIYSNIQEKEKKYNGTKSIRNNDIVKVPNLKIDLVATFDQISFKPFYFSNGEEHYIEKAMQTIKFNLDKKGATLKSEAAIQMATSGLKQVEIGRKFILDDTFAIFLKENDKSTPYFAAKINDISKF